MRQTSTRRGEMVTLSELIEAIGVDAARFFLVAPHDQTDLDIGLARKQSQENPCTTQYAHARIASILRNLPEDLAPGVISDPEVLPPRTSVISSRH